MKMFRVEIKISVSPTKDQDPFVLINLYSSDLVIVLNPHPLISAAQTVIEFSEIPFCPRTEVSSDDSQAGEAVLSTNIHVGVSNTSILFMSDFTEILRGILVLDVDDLLVKIQSSGMSGDLVISTVPISFCAGQIIQQLSFSDDSGCIDWAMLPSKPILSAHGIRLRASGKEKKSELDHSQELIAQPSCIELDIDVGTETFVLNVSPSTLVALIGVSTSLEPFMEWTAGEDDKDALVRLEKEALLEEEKKSFLNRRQALLEVFNSVDADESGLLQDEEIDNMIHVLLAEDIEFGNDASQVVDVAQRLTPEELKRERDFFISNIDPMHPNRISYRDVDAILFLIAHHLDDNNLSPKIGPTGVEYLDEYSQTKTFLSARTMRSLVYFDDLREYAAMHEVYRLTGHANGLTFPAPSLWHQGRGIDTFWDLYTRETGCSRNSLNDQNPAVVQRKLVRSLW